MFFPRCAFWLSVMYVGISFNAGSPRSPRAFEAAVASEALSVAGAAVAHATDLCAKRPAQCVRDAARLTALVETTAAEPASGGEDVVLADTQASHAPLPVPASRHRAARAVLTDAR